MLIEWFQYGIEESLGLHIIVSNFVWWMSLILVILAYRARHIWNVGEMPWAFLSLMFIFFGLRELGHFVRSPLLSSLRYVLGIWSGIFMASALLCLYVILCQRKKLSKKLTYIPFVLAFIFPLIWLYLYLSDVQNLKNTITALESIVWIFAGSIAICTTFMLGTRVTGDFVKVFMLFQFSAYFVISWKFLGLLELAGCPIPYSLRESFETLFGIFAVLSMYVLTRMLRRLSKKLHSDQYGHKS